MGAFQKLEGVADGQFPWELLEPSPPPDPACTKQLSVFKYQASLNG